MFNNKLQGIEQSKEEIHYDDSEKKTSTSQVYVRVIRPVKITVIQTPTTGQSVESERF